MGPTEQQDQTPQPNDQAPQATPAASAAPIPSAVFPDRLGVALALTLVVGLALAGTFAYYAVRHEQQQAQESEGQALTDTLAVALGQVASRQDSAVAAVTFGQLCADSHAIRFAQWVDPTGAVRCRWPSATVPGQESLAPASREDETGEPPDVSPPEKVPMFTAAVRTLDGSPAGTLHLAFAFEGSTRPVSMLWRGCAVAAIASLLMYFALYRRLRHHLRPLDAIQRNLHSYASGLEKEFVALSLSDSLGRVAQAWNHLIEQVAALRDQGVDAGQPDLAGDVLRRFESRKLRTMLDRLPVGVLCFGQDQRVTYANLAAGRLLERPVDALLGMPLEEALDEEVRAPLVGAFMRSVAAMSIDRKRGPEEQQTTLRFALIPAEESSPDGEALVTIEDVSHLQEADRARDNFLYHVTHELRTPLTNIQAYAETLTGPGFDDEQTRRECYNVIISETRRLSRLIEDILNISQLEVGTARVEMTAVDLVRLLRQIVQDHLGAADEKQIDLTLKLAPKVPEVRGDKQRLSVLMTNLIGNAIKYTPQGGHVNVTLEVRERCVEVVVADTGIGIAPEDQAHVFDKFYRAVSDQVQTVAGTGLGLAIAREVARLHGGDIRLESVLAEGSRFVVELPRPVTEA